MPAWMRLLRERAHALRRDALALWIACRHPDAPLAPRLLCLVIVAYAFSPIDLIPDFIPLLGLLDELLLLPGLVWLAFRLLPGALVQASRAEAERRIAAPAGGPGRALRVAGAAAVIGVWALLLWWVWRWFDAAA
jgi:uncharacterized membrane protein YkvA (DUF1232 family)